MTTTQHTARTSTEIADVALILRALGRPEPLYELCEAAATMTDEFWFRTLLGQRDLLPEAQL